ncbi:71b3d30e-2c26-4003-8ed3-518dc3459f90 [Sclerotinia trifoliorum]|uniref:Small ribosomal subunit protein bS18m n=1 Tax=Sclerotinia trifoliorum TaxID=28548 RepID=A0A8H2VTY0_9HELO|nr:71b3d30e-2c26-4003-8ed3-518dc3459f90 [Sclerotinia trifoliorum]
MPPRLQCLNAARDALSMSALRMRFSTSKVVSAELPSAFDTSSSDVPGMGGLISLLNKTQERRRAVQPPLRVTAQNSALENGAWQTKTDLTKQIHRRWKAGDVYAPHDLSGIEMSKWKKRGKVTRDVFDVVAFDPIATGSYKNFSIMSEYVTPMGRIRGSKETGLRPVNQRKIAKAIRRSIGMGMMPSVHRHPEVLYKARERDEQNDNYKRGVLV